MLRLILYGGFSLKGEDGAEIPLKSKRGKALLTYLALPKGKARSREEIMALLWSDRGEAQARASLRQVLTGLRKELGQEARDVLRISDEAVSLDPEHVTVEQGSHGEELLEGLHINDPAFDEWLRDERLRLEDDVRSESRPGSTHPDAADKPSIAVLPFVNMSDDSEQAYFADGITEDIITALSHISALSVIAFYAAEIYEGKTVDVRSVGQDQGVRYVLEGSVRKSGNRIRVTVQLVDAETAEHIWAERYDRELADIFAVQDEITKRVATELNVKLARGQEIRSLAGGTTNVEAWEKIVRAWPLTDEHVKGSCVEARKLALEAIELDPHYDAAWVVLGWAHYTSAMWGWTESKEQSIEQAIHCAENAIEYGPERSGGYALLGNLYVMIGRMNEGIEICRKGLALEPNSAIDTALVGMSMAFGGKPEESIPLMQRAMRLSPVYPQWYNMIVGAAHLQLGDHESAIAILRECVAKEPETYLHKLWLASALIETGQRAEARELAKVVIVEEPSFSVGNWLDSFTKDPVVTVLLTKNLSEAGLPA